MTYNRRVFLKNSVFLSGAGMISLNSLMGDHKFEEKHQDVWPTIHFEEHGTEEDFWTSVRASYTINPNIINLNNGGVAPQPKVVQDAHIRQYQYANEGPSYYMWRIMDQGREPLRRKLARISNCDPEEIAINRNATEGLNSIIFGLNLKEGDEVVLSKYDYPNMMNAWKQREKRDKIKLVWVDFELPQEEESYFLERYQKAINSKTKVVHITHMINWVGQVMPVKKIADYAHQMGCEVIVDGAHSFGHIHTDIPSLGADYYATSLHKWMSAPFGTGMMYIRKANISKVWALLSSDQPDGDNIRKFESLGTRSFAAEMAISQAVDFHEMIGMKRKQDRLYYLKNYWVQQVISLPGVRLRTPMTEKHSGAIGLLEIKGLKGTELESKLYEKYKIHTVAIEYESVSGIRITPNVYTSLNDLDILVQGIKELAK